MPQKNCLMDPQGNGSTKCATPSLFRCFVTGARSQHIDLYFVHQSRAKGRNRCQLTQIEVRVITWYGTHKVMKFLNEMNPENSINKM